ncbi:MAG: hypothetical protein Q8K65_03455, partial [Alphaproteobacteria bacterium]|nr:hypothetical protein [Alphaproteobacteria bacterium]
HSIQIEINRALYMNEKTLRRLPRAARLQDDLQGTLESFRSYCDAALTPKQKPAAKRRPPQV